MAGGDNRESGAKPERSGHCEQGVGPCDAIAGRNARRYGQVMICKPGNLLKILMNKLPTKVGSCEEHEAVRLHGFL